MTVPLTRLRLQGTLLDGARIVIGPGGLAVAVTVRVDVAGVAGSQSARAGSVFALLLVCLAGLTASRAAALAELSWRRGLRLAGYGMLGAAALCVPAVWRQAVFGNGALAVDSISAAGYWPWAMVVTVVAIAEEALLRGSLYRAVGNRYGAAAAIAVTSAAFALLHVPVYGWHVVLLDLGVGVWLGALRAVTGSVAVPAVAHTLADLAGWWLR